VSHVLEPATSGRAKCRGCGRTIARGELRLGDRLPNPFADDGGEMTHWYHLPCGAYRRPEAFVEALAASDAIVEDRGALEHEARLGMAHRRLPRVTAAERSPSGRASCRSCREPIAKGAWRISLVYYQDGRFVPSGFIHARCVRAYVGVDQIGHRLRHFSLELNETDLAEIEREVGSEAR
jgi:hypothetical protein